MNKDNLKKIILYLIKVLRDSVEGKKKLMKLMFLVEHYDLKEKKLNRNGLFGLDYRIYYYGVFSQQVSDVISDLIKENEIEDGFPLKLKRDVVIDGPIKEKIDSVVEIFGKKGGYLLEVDTLKMLGYDPSEKDKIFGKEVKELIK